VGQREIGPAADAADGLDQEIFVVGRVAQPPDRPRAAGVDDGRGAALSRCSSGFRLGSSVMGARRENSGLGANRSSRGMSTMAAMSSTPMWPCRLINPGQMNQPGRSITRSACPSKRWPAYRMRSPRTATSPRATIWWRRPSQTAAQPPRRRVVAPASVGRPSVMRWRCFLDRPVATGAETPVRGQLLPRLWASGATLTGEQRHVGASPPMLGRNPDAALPSIRCCRQSTGMSGDAITCLCDVSRQGAGIASKPLRPPVVPA
jgi:hypothetical protein